MKMEQLMLELNQIVSKIIYNNEKDVLKLIVSGKYNKIEKKVNEKDYDKSEELLEKLSNYTMEKELYNYHGDDLLGKLIKISNIMAFQYFGSKPLTEEDFVPPSNGLPDNELILGLNHILSNMIYNLEEDVVELIEKNKYDEIKQKIDKNEYKDSDELKDKLEHILSNISRSPRGSMLKKLENLSENILMKNAIQLDSSMLDNLMLVGKRLEFLRDEEEKREKKKQDKLTNDLNLKKVEHFKKLQVRLFRRVKDKLTLKDFNLLSEEYLKEARKTINKALSYDLEKRKKYKHRIPLEKREEFLMDFSNLNENYLMPLLEQRVNIDYFLIIVHSNKELNNYDSFKNLREIIEIIIKIFDHSNYIKFQTSKDQFKKVIYEQDKKMINVIKNAKTKDSERKFENQKTIYLNNSKKDKQKKEKERRKVLLKLKETPSIENIREFTEKFKFTNEDQSMLNRHFANKKIKFNLPTLKLLKDTLGGRYIKKMIYKMEK